MRRTLAGLLLAGALAGARADNRFCSGAVLQSGEPTGLAQVWATRPSNTWPNNRPA